VKRRNSESVENLISRVPIPVPWNVEQLAFAVGEVLRGPIHLITRSAVEDDRIYATVVAGADGYYIFVRDDLTGMHRDLAICHELGHILAGHLSDASDALRAPKGIAATVSSLSPALIARMLNRECCHDARHEREAERIATALLARGRGQRPPPANPIARGLGEALQ
jgi:hypothetical protein